MKKTFTAINGEERPGQAVQEGRGEPGVTEDFRPAGEVQVGGHQHRATFVPFSKKAE